MSCFHGLRGVSLCLSPSVAGGACWCLVLFLLLFVLVAAAVGAAVGAVCVVSSDAVAVYGVACAVVVVVVAAVAALAF